MQEEISERTIALGEKGTKFTLEMLEKMMAYDREDVAERKSRAFLRKGLTKNQEQVMDYLKKHPMATLQEAASGCELSRGGVKKICSRLQEIGVLERKGSKRDGRWIVK